MDDKLILFLSPLAGILNYKSHQYSISSLTFSSVCMASNGLSIKELLYLWIFMQKQNAMFYFSCLNTGQSKIQKIEITIMMKKQAKKFIIHSKNFMNINKVKNGTTSISFYGQRSSFLPLPSFYHSYISNKKVLNPIGQNFFHLLSYSI